MTQEPRRAQGTPPDLEIATRVVAKWKYREWKQGLRPKRDRPSQTSPLDVKASFREGRWIRKVPVAVCGHCDTSITYGSVYDGADKVTPGKIMFESHWDEHHGIWFMTAHARRRIDDARVPAPHRYPLGAPGWRYGILRAIRYRQYAKCPRCGWINRIEPPRRS